MINIFMYLSSTQENRYYSALCLSIAFWIFFELLAILHLGHSYLQRITFSMGAVNSTIF